MLCYVYSMTKVTQNDLRLANRIRRLRKQKDLTQEQLAEKVHVSTTHVGLVETGKRKFGLKTLQKVANVLGVKVKDLIPY